MPELRAALGEAGFTDVRTYLQSGNVILNGGEKPDVVARRVRSVIVEAFGLDIAVVARTRAQLAKVLDLNPLGKVATDPKRYQVIFLEAKPPRDLARRLEETAAAEERVIVHGREIYAWHPHTVARSRLSALLADKKLGVTATARNWRTVQKLLETADAPERSR